MTDREWREQLKAGDEVRVCKPFGYPSIRGKVVRTTATRVIVECNPWGGGRAEYPFRKDDGHAIPWKRDGLRIDSLVKAQQP